MRNNPVMKNNAMLERAKELRRDMTPQEKQLWYHFLQHYPTKVYKQRIIDSFIADFYCSAARLVIEVDGKQHYTEQGLAYDEQRAAIISRYGIEVIRFTNQEIDEKFKLVTEKIDLKIRERVIKCKEEEEQLEKMIQGLKK